jgi:hypothetical protein
MTFLPSSLSGAPATGSDLLRHAVRRLDTYLRRRQGIREFTNCPDCLLRYSLGTAPTDVVLSNGVSVRRGDPIVELHLWNEHIPVLPDSGPDLAWALAARQRMRRSLQELAVALTDLPEMQDVAACRGQTVFAGQQQAGAALFHLLQRFGFEAVDEGRPTIGRQAHDLFEDVLIGALTWTYNPAGLRRDKLLRRRCPAWISRAQVIERYGPKSVH